MKRYILLMKWKIQHNKKNYLSVFSAVVIKNLASLVAHTCNTEDPDLIPGSGTYPGRGINHHLQYFGASL